jgi:hypothetical protein
MLPPSTLCSLKRKQITTGIRNGKYMPSSWTSWRFKRFITSRVHCQCFTSLRLRHLIRCHSRAALPFHLVIDLKDADRKRYTPHNDFHVSIRDFPHIILEVNSQPNEGDEFRMLLQAACFARIGNWLRDRTHDKPIVIMAIYISKDFMARQHVVYQPDVNSMAVVFHWVFTESLWLMQYFSFKVEYATESFDLTVPQAALEFIFQLYNFFSFAEDDNRHLRQPGSRLEEAKESVARKHREAFTTRTPTKRKQEDNQRNSKKSRSNHPDTTAQGGEEDCFGNPSVQREVTRAGYTPTPPLPKDFTLLTPVSRNSSHCIRNLV